MSGPFAADYDCDNMSLFVLKDSQSVEECKCFNCPHADWSPYSSELSHFIDDYQAMCTTLCWSDSMCGVIVTKCHEELLTKKAQFISLTNTHKSVMDFITTAISTSGRDFKIVSTE
jgi:hypothetical protein